MMLSDSITKIKGIGPRKAELFGKLGLFSLRDLLYYFPRTHKDYSNAVYVMAAKHGDDAALSLTIRTEPRLARIRRGMSITSARAFDGSGDITLTWYNQPYRANSLHAGDSVIACGRVDRSRGTKLINPMLFAELPGILPVYPLIKGISQNQLRDATRAALEACAGGISETLPETLIKRYGLTGLYDALRGVHYPADMAAAAAARRRLAFEDMLVFRLMLTMMQSSLPKRRRTIQLEGVKDEFIARLPFAPTGAQLRAMDEIAEDLAKARLMNRLLQGDVGSGKTAVAMFAMFAAIKNGMQAALMAPTEILALQHYAVLCRVFGEQNTVLLRGGMKKAEREAAMLRIKNGSAMAVTGTHALLQEDVEFFDLGLVVTDEQHRFGVKQRALISAKGDLADVLIMSATPIPRTLALILYGDLEVSELNELPPGRKPVLSRLVPHERREDMYRFIEAQVRTGRQAYVVCPLVDGSEALDSVQSAIELYDELTKTMGVSVGLLHGQMSAAQKEKAAAAFRAGETGVLVATTVIEVGVDVPNATIMAIENADRFGLAQLHQLRGRVGRGNEASYCFLLSQADSDTARERLSTLIHTNNGFEIAEKDLEMRGPGEFLGKRQHGISEFAAASLAMDMEALNEAKEAAELIMHSEKMRSEAAGVLLRAKEKLTLLKGEIAPN